MYTSNYDWLDYYKRTTPDETALIDIANERKFSYSEMETRVGKLAHYLVENGVTPGDRVGCLALNTTDIFEIMFAVWRVGAIYLALNFRLTTKELSGILDHAEPVMVFVDQTFDETVMPLREKNTDIFWVRFDGAGGDTQYEQAIKKSPHLSSTQIALEHVPNQQALLMYSSGTTGTPKGIIISHDNIFYASTASSFSLKVNRHCVSYAVMPIFHIGALMGFCLPSLLVGGTTILNRNFEPGATLSTIGNKEYGITHFLGLPAIFNTLQQHPDCTSTDFSNLKVLVGGAESMPLPLLNWWKDNAIPIQEVYGLTESTGVGCVMMKSDIATKIGSAGQASIFSEFRIMDEKGQEVPRGELGEICIKGGNITSGYWRNPEATKAAFFGDWFRTGDIGRMDEQSYVYIVDRLKDMYISGGENIYPAEIESALCDIPQILEVAVIGYPDEKWGEVGCAVVVLKRGCTLSLEDITAHCEGQLAKFKHPKHMVEVDTLPRNATGKVLKFELRQALSD